MKISKRLFRHPFTQRIVCFFAATYIKIIHLTTRWDVVDGHIPQAFWQQNKPFILSFWHGRLLMLPFCWRRKQPVHMLISNHPDGQLIGRTISYFKIKMVKGSTSRGGATALKKLIRALKNKEYVGITPDGPRGPYMKVSPGAINLAKIAGVPIIPVAYAVARGKHLKSWDRFLVAWPFGKGVFVWGKPLVVGKKDDLEKKRVSLEKEMIRITTKADTLLGRQTP